MKKRFEGKSILIIGASGGLGGSYARAFINEGGKLLLAGRNEEKLRALADKLPGDVTISIVDVTEAKSVKRLAEFARDWSEKIDVVVNATGCDIRKSLESYEFEDVNKSLDTNLLGAILVTKVFLPYMREEKGSSIVHMGGFADGHLAFPYYSVDVATRAGVFSFIEAMNRELYQEGSKVSLTYFCPNAADTTAEKPYHKIWQEMGIAISSAEQVASELLKAIECQKAVYIMGGFPIRFFANLNTLFPKLADVLLLKKYGSILKKYLSNSTHNKVNRTKRKGIKKFAIGLVILSFVLYALLPIVPFLNFDAKIKVAITAAMMGTSEVIFWVGGAILGKEIVAKYKKYINPVNWICCKKQ